MDNKIKAFQVYYDEKHIKSLQEGFIPYFNEKASPYLESKILCELYNKNLCTDCDYMGMFSWKTKTKIKNFNFRNLQKTVDNNIDADLIAPKLSNYNLKGTNRPHSILRKLNSYKSEETILLFKKLVDKMQIKKIIPTDSYDNFFYRRRNILYFNAFLAKIKTFNDFTKNFLIPTINLLEENEEFYNKMMQPVFYGRNKCPQKFKDDTGLDYYPHVCFILERMINLYIYINKDLNIKWEI
jgi:hypothetical protein